MSEKTASLLKSRTLLGLATIALGVLLTLDNLGLVDFGTVLGHWPILLLVLGVSRLRRSPGLGWFLLLIGAAFLARRYLDVGVAELWPVLLLFFGASLVLRSFGGGRRRPQRRATESVESDQVDLFVLLASRRRQITADRFRGGTLTAMLGGCDLDLREAGLADGEAELEVLALWGGITLRVPEDWSVSLQVSPIMGGADDSRFRNDSPLEMDPVDKESDGAHLVVRGLVFMGGIEVRL